MPNLKTEGLLINQQMEKNIQNLLIVVQVIGTKFLMQITTLMLPILMMEEPLGLML
jgi:hypothetical protein